MKIKKRFVCSQCGYFSLTWVGKCPECGNWNSFIEEEVIDSKEIYNINYNKSSKELININDIKEQNNILLKTDCNELNDFFGDGLVAGSVILLAGEPGIGKSTFLLFIVKNINNDKIFYFSGEETSHQIKKRIDRIKIDNKNFFLSNEMDIEKICDICSKQKPKLIFIDSIQTFYSTKIESLSGSISQVKYCTSKLIEIAKNFDIIVIIVGHITKSGDISGPKIIEHMVDVVCYFENDYKNQFRILRLVKNRFGNVDDILIFEMKEEGLILIDNPGKYFIEQNNEDYSIGKCKTIILEGKKPILIEIEALVVPSIYVNARRFSEGIDIARVNRIAAILNKHLNENLNNYDIYVNISGGIKTKDVSCDLAIAMAIYSSKNNKKIKNDSLYIGELSLTGKVRNIYNVEKRINESKKLGIKTIYIPYNNNINLNDYTDININLMIEINMHFFSR